MRSDGAEARPAASATVHKSVHWLTDGEAVEVFAGPYPAIQPPIHLTPKQIWSQHCPCWSPWVSCPWPQWPQGPHLICHSMAEPLTRHWRHICCPASAGGRHWNTGEGSTSTRARLRTSDSFKQHCFFIKLSLSTCSRVHPNWFARLPRTQCLPSRSVMMYQKVRNLLGIQW